MKNIFKKFAKKLFLLVSICLTLDAQAATPNICSIEDIKSWVEKSRISSVLAPHYPPLALRLGQKGRAIVKITLDSESRIESANLRYSTGYKNLDDGIMSMIQRNSGLKLDLPACAKKDERFSFDLSLVFKINDGDSVPSRDLLLELFKATQLLEGELNQASNIIYTILNAIKQTNPNASTEALSVIDQEVRQAINKELSPGGAYLEKIIEIHQLHYSEEDVRYLISFYQSHLGRKVINSLGLIQSEMQKFGEIWRPRFNVDLSDRINSRFKERGLPYELPRPKSSDSEQKGQRKDLS